MSQQGNLENPSSHVVDEASKTAEDVASSLLASEALESLDPAVVPLQRLTGGLGAGLLWLGALVGGVVLWRQASFPPILIVLIWSFCTVFFLLSLWLVRPRFEAFSFRLTHRVFEIRSGIVWKKSIMIPLSRLQHVDLSTGPLERQYGLSTLEVYTAGTSNASVKVSGLSRTRGFSLRQELIAAADLEPDPQPGDGELPSS